MNQRVFLEYIEYIRTTKAKNIPIVWTVPGLVFGFNHSILKFIEYVRTTLYHDKAYLVINTWDIRFNNQFMGALNKHTNPETGKYKNIELILTKDKYEDTGIIDISQRLLKDLGITKPGYFDGVVGKGLYYSPHHFKRLVYFYSHHRTFSYIYHRFSNEDNSKGALPFPLVFRLSPKFVMQNYKWVNSKFLKVIIHLFDYAQKHLNVTDIEKVNHPYDVLYTVDSGSSYYDDMLYASSPETLVNIFGLTEEDFYQKLLNFYKRYIDRYPGTLESDKDFTTFGEDRFYLPLEGSTIMKDFADDSKNKIINVSCRWLGELVSHILPFKNPWFSLHGTELIEDAYIKKDKLLLNYLRYDTYKDLYVTSTPKNEI